MPLARVGLPVLADVARLGGWQGFLAGRSRPSRPKPLAEQPRQLRIENGEWIIASSEGWITRPTGRGEAGWLAGIFRRPKPRISRICYEFFWLFSW